MEASELLVNNLFYHATNRPSEIEKQKIIDFLSKNLEGKEPSKDYIRKAIEYATKDRVSFGGFIIVKKNINVIIGAAIVNHTGMSGYMAENILAYIAVDEKHRGKGLAKKIIEQVVNQAKGDVALHLKGDSKLADLCQKFGFKKAIVEMRLER